MSAPTTEESSPASSSAAPSDDPAVPRSSLLRLVLGRPRNLHDGALFHKISLVAILAWVGLGADGLSSSAYGPEEAFRTLGEHTYLAVGLAALMAVTVLIISAGYSRIIERFPHGGGGYVVASKLLGPHVGLLSGCALVIDYVLTITISIAASGDAIFSFLPPHWHAWKLPFEVAMVGALTIVNLRGVRESILTLTPVFALFVVSHLVLIVGGLVGHAKDLPDTATHVAEGFSHGWSTLGLGGLLMLLLHAFSLGGGTYTGIEAVSNGVPIMRHPQVRTAKRTMALMAISLAFTATGLLLCYLLWRITPEAGKTMNAVLVERLTQGLPFATILVVIVLLSEGALLIVAAQAGFTDGPRVLANMAIDSWVPRRFSALSDRLTTQNGILLMGGAAVVALLYTRGDVRHIVVMYSINVFLTFSLSLLGMLLLSWRERTHGRGRALLLFGGGLSLCLTILCITVVEKFGHGGWVTLIATGGLFGACLLVKRHYRTMGAAIDRAFAGLEKLPPPAASAPGTLDPAKPTAVIMVGAWGGIGVHTLLNVVRTFPGHFRNVVFVSVAVIDTGGFKGEDSVSRLAAETQSMLNRYVEYASRLGLSATSRLRVGTEAADGAVRLAIETAREFPHSTFFAGQILFRSDTWISRLLHNQTANVIQRRLQWAGLNMLVVPARVG